MRLLLISNSTNPGEKYLEWTKQYIQEFLAKNNVKTTLFVPYAGVALDVENLKKSYAIYEKKVADVFSTFGVSVRSIHREKDPVLAIKNAECVVVGGGNTFHLVSELHKNKLMPVIRKRVLEGMPFMGWSAGSNVACPTLHTTNDMPIIEPESFKCLNIIPFQINPHYLDLEAHPKGFGGETRDDRIKEFLVVNKKVTVIGLREACLLEVEEEKMELKGRHSLKIFKYGKETQEVSGDVSFLMQ